MTLIIEKKKVITYTHHDRTKHMSWCLKNDIIISYNSIDNYWGFISIEQDGVLIELDERYKSRKKDLKSKDKVWSKEIMKLYTNKYLENHE